MNITEGQMIYSGVLLFREKKPSPHCLQGYSLISADTISVMSGKFNVWRQFQYEGKLCFLYIKGNTSLDYQNLNDLPRDRGITNP